MSEYPHYAVPGERDRLLKTAALKAAINLNREKGNMSDLPCQVPLVELLESVPVSAREMIEINPTHHRNIPYGRYCHDAARDLRALRAEVTTQQNEVLRLSGLLRVAHTERNDAVKSMTALRAELTAAGIRVGDFGRADNGARHCYDYADSMLAARAAERKRE